MRRISSHFVFTPQGLLPDTVVTVSDKGVITDISQTGALDREAGVEFYPGILMPGTVNAHCHLELSHLRGTIPAGGGFRAFVDGMKKAGRNDTDGAADFWDARMWSEGVAAVGDICNGEETFALKRRSRIHYHSFVEIFGGNADPGRARSLRDGAEAMGLAAGVTPHALYSLSSDNFAAAVGDEKNSVLSIHFMESEVEVPSPAERLTAQVPPDRRVMLVHNCLVTQRDIDIVMGHFTAPVTWVLCPRSNRYISNIVPPVELLRKNKLNIAIGTDSLASNDDLSMAGEMALFGNVPLVELLGWATIGGARALGLDGPLGSIEVGKSPGLALLSGADMQKSVMTENAHIERII